MKHQDYPAPVADLVQAALAAADPQNAVTKVLRRDGRLLYIGDIIHDLEQGRVFIISVGKAAASMAEAALEVIGDAFHAGIVIAKKDSKTTENLLQMNNPDLGVFEGNHPVPGEDSIKSTAAVIELLKAMQLEDLVIFLISGGASAILTDPIVTLDEWQQLNNALLASGCPIHEFNTVRRQFDRIKGGGLAAAAAPARCVSLILSDVIGNPLEAIGSGPTVLIDEKPEDAQNILERYDVQGRLEPLTWQHLQEALQQLSQSAGGGFIRSEHVIVGDVRRAATAVLTKAMQLGFVSQIMTTQLEGEAREVGRVLAAIAKELPAGRCLIFGGETTVTLRGDGLGGRNQELALSAAIALDGWSNILLFTLATDGEDGPTSAAGAVVTGETVQLAAKLNLDVYDALARNDSHRFFANLMEAARADEINEQPAVRSGLLLTGSTGTNVNDLVIILTFPTGNGALNSVNYNVS